MVRILVSVKCCQTHSESAICDTNETGWLVEAARRGHGARDGAQVEALDDTVEMTNRLTFHGTTPGHPADYARVAVDDRAKREAGIKRYDVPAPTTHVISPLKSYAQDGRADAVRMDSAGNALSDLQLGTAA